MKRSILITALVGAITIAGLTAAHRMEAGGFRTTPSRGGQGAVLVELFTSEGCSSCPPADALLQQVNGKYTDAGALIVGISEHVTYWDYLGWTDPFSSAAYTDRQTAYGRRFNLDGVYTPQMVINGEEQIVGSDRGALARALNRQSESPKLEVHIESASVAAGSLTLAYSIQGKIPDGGADLFAVIGEDGATSRVLRGENSGRTLSHVSVARVIAHVGKVNAAAEQTVTVPLSQLPGARPGEARHLILFAQLPGFGRVIGVDTAPV